MSRNRFNLTKKIVLYRRTLDQSVQQIRQIRTFPRNQNFAIRDLIYLFAPYAGPLQSKSRTLPFLGAVHIKPIETLFI